MKSFINILIFLFIILPGVILVVCGGGFVLVSIQFTDIISELQHDPDGTLLIVGAPILGCLLILGGIKLTKKINFKDKKSINNRH